MSDAPSTSRIGAVAIGRNEGERLATCLSSLAAGLAPGDLRVYVDSGSTDASVSIARGLGVEVVNLDMSIPFAAARARNEGLARLLEKDASVKYVQFIDGDCEMNREWIAKARAVLDAEPRTAVVFGWRRERFPAASIYNRLCDLEWTNGAPGIVKACGGDALMRVAAVNEAGGFDPTVVAGEEPELCVRLRAKGWQVRRLDAPMTLHDAAITSFKPWWKRMVRSGHAYAQAMAMHGGPPEKHGVRQSLGIWMWAAAWPLLILALAWPTHGWSLLGLLVYPLQVVKIARHRRQGWSASDVRLYALACVVGKWAQLEGQMVFWKNRLRGRGTRIIEYKGAAASATLAAGPAAAPAPAATDRRAGSTT